MTDSGGGHFKYDPRTHVRTRQDKLGVNLECEVFDCDEDEFELNKMMAYCCCAERLRVAPKRGSAVLFFPLMRNGTVDERVAHGACPVLREHDEKWAVQQWFEAGAVPRDL
jgi:hypothetical protein